MYALAIPLGILGAHRFYVNKPFTGFSMLMSGGGGLAWWLWDLFHLRQMTQAFNAEEAHREASGLPPQGLGFLPAKGALNIHTPPAWSARRSGRARVYGSALLLALIGFSMGAISGATDLYEPVIVMALFVVVSLLAARWKPMTTLPILSSLARWAHRLRLYYHTVDPGNIWLLATRPLYGIFIAPWQPKARAEIRLYLQLGVAFALLLAIPDILEMMERGFWRGLGLLLGEFLQILVYTYAFVAPAGALLTTQLLLTTRDRVVWVLSVLLLSATWLGFSVVN